MLHTISPLSQRWRPTQLWGDSSVYKLDGESKCFSTNGAEAPYISLEKNKP
jgi:hypothetical protein